MSTTVVGRAPYADRAARPQAELPWWGWAVAAALIFLTGVFGVLFAPVGTAVAVWWPAAGLSVLLALLQPAGRIPHVLLLVLVVTSLANAIAGRPLLVAVAFGIANALEVAVIAGVLQLPRRRFELSSLRAGIRFAIAVVVGALVAGVLAALAVALLEGSALWTTIGFVAASHAAGVALVAPLGALPRPVPVAAGRVEMLVQALVLAAVIAIVFHPSSSLPLAFAPFPMLAWAALRFPIRFVLAESIVAGLAMLALTLDGGGPFRREEFDELVGAAMFEAMLVTFAGLAVVLSSAQYELRLLSRQVEATNRLLTGSVVDARIGLIVAERGAESTSVAWSNRAASRLLAAEVADGLWSGPLRTAAMAALRTGEQVTVEAAGDRTITVAAHRIDGEGERIAVQLLDVTALLRARRARVEAEVEREATRSIRAELERQRDDFLVTTSHELRTPITSIIGYAELLADGGMLTGPEREWVAVIERNAERLSELVEDLLTLSGGATAPPRPARPERIPCEALFREVAANLRVVSEPKRLDVRLEPAGLSVLASRSDASRMLSNLLVNACKFTPEGGRIAVRAEAHGDDVRLLVADTGPGMTDDEMAHAFERFYRAQGAERDNVAGAGLGLPIVAELARRNGGSVGLARNADGGLTAVLQLPSGPADSPAQPAG